MRKEQACGEGSSSEDHLGLNLNANRRSPGEQMNDCRGAPHTRAYVDEDIRLAHRSVLDDSQEIIDRARQIGCAAFGKLGTVVGNLGKPERQVEPCVPVDGRHLEQS